MRPEYPVKRRNPARIVKFAKGLRRAPTEAERKLWHRINREQIEGFKFRRQAPIGRYIADFLCMSERLVIELDGGQHEEGKLRDDARTAWLETQGYRVLRFWNSDVFDNLDGVLDSIRLALLKT